MHWRTSIGASAAWLICAAIDIARASSLDIDDPEAGQRLPRRDQRAVGRNGSALLPPDGLGFGWVSQALLDMLARTLPAPRRSAS